MAYPLSVRQRIVELYQEGEQTQEIAETFNFSKAGVRRVHQHYRERGSVLPKPGGHGVPSQLTSELEQRLREFVAAYPDATRDQIKAELDLTVTLQCISKWLKRLKLVLKKSPRTPASRTDPTSLRPEPVGLSS